MTGFNKTLDVNLEHTELDYTLNQSINHHPFSEKKKIQKQLSSPLIWVVVAMLSVPSSVRFPIPSSISSPVAFNDVEAESR